MAIIITGDVLNGGASTSTFTLSKEEIADALRESGVDLVADLRPTILKFVYFGIAILIGAYLAQALWVFTSERLTRVLLLFFIIFIFLMANCKMIENSREIRTSYFKTRYWMARYGCRRISHYTSLS